MFKDTKIAGRFHKLAKVIVFLLVVTMVMPNLFLNETWAGTGSKTTPGKVTVKSLKTSGTNKVVIKWNKAKNVSSYRISYKTGDGGWVTVATVKGNKTSYTHKSSKNAPLVSGRKYTYKVEGYNKKSDKYGAYKAKNVAIPAGPGTVKLISAKFAGKNVVVKWKKTSNATEYRIMYRANEKSKWKKIATAKSNKSSLTIKKGKIGYYTVQAYNKKLKKYGNYDTKGLALLNKTSVAKPEVVIKTPVVEPSTTPVPEPSATPVPETEKEVIPTGIQFTQSQIVLKSKDEKCNLNDYIKITPANAAKREIWWESSEPGFVKVDENGNVTAIKRGYSPVYAYLVIAHNNIISKSVVVFADIPKEARTQEAYIGEESGITVCDDDYEGVDFTKVELEIDDSLKSCIEFTTEEIAGPNHCFYFMPKKSGSGVVDIKYNGKTIDQIHMNVVTATVNEDD